MKCLMKYQWVKLPRNRLPEGKGLMGYWTKLASRAASVKENILLAFGIVLIISVIWFFISYQIAVKVYRKRDIN